MIRVTPGSTNSFSLRALTESILLLPKEKQSLFKMYTQGTFMNSLKSAMIDMNNDDILLNLPADKSEFIENDKKFSGHTEYYRSFYKINELAMCFMGINSNMLLLTDHIPLREVPGKLDPRLIFKKIELAISGFKNCHREIEKIVLLGINPHAGEHGSLGNEELTIYTKLFDLLSDSNPSLHKEIVPSDGFFLLNNFDSKTLIVSPYHDQGLSIFKALNGFAGTHLTFGLPFLRMSPIHGTAKKMSYNEFNPMGIVYTFLDALKLHN